MKDCDAGFQGNNSKECFYFIRGHCLKGDTCAFKHGNQRNYTPECRNGSHCRYLSSGICSFFHPGVGVQRPKPEYSQAKNGQGWCKYSENCFRIPNCPFIHSEEDFPQLPKTSKPPLGAERMANAWEEY